MTLAGPKSDIGRAEKSHKGQNVTLECYNDIIFNRKSYWVESEKCSIHYSGVIMSTTASQIIGVSIVCSTVCREQIKKVKAPRHWPLCGESTGEF